MNIIKTSDLTSLTLFGSEGIIGREHLSVHIQNLFEFSIETRENEALLNTRESVKLHQNDRLDASITELTGP